MLLGYTLDGGGSLSWMAPTAIVPLALLVTISALEVFGMYRKTDGLDWFLSLSGNEIKLMVLLSDFADERGYLSLSTMRRQFLMSALGIKSRRSLSGLIADLERKDMLFRTSQNDFLVNPATFFRCKSAELAERIMAYAAAKKGGYIKLIPIVNETD